MKHTMIAAALLAGAVFSTATRAQSEASALSTLSAVPVASVVGAASVATVALPVALSTAGAVLVVKSVEVGARSSVYLLERASDGARVSVEVVHRGVHQASLAAGASVTVTVFASGVVLSAAGEAIAFLPNALGRALLHNERLTY